MSTDDPTQYNKADIKATEALVSEMQLGVHRPEWGDVTLCAVATTQPDEHGNFQVGILDYGELASDPITCNVNDDPRGELSEVLSLFAQHYAEIWQAQRHERFNREGWKVPPGGRALPDDDDAGGI